MTAKNGNSILLVEDERDIRSYLKKMLSVNGFDVLEAADGTSALNIYDRHKSSIDVIASDLCLPGVNGCELAIHNYQSAFLPFVAFTGNGNFEAAFDLLRFGVKDYLMKPIEESRFISILKNAISRRFPGKEENPKATSYDGNIGSIKIPSKLEEIHSSSLWLKSRLGTVMKQEKARKLSSFAGELIMNSHEHGNMKIGKEEKARLIDEREYEEELVRREKKYRAHIQIDLLVMTNQIAISISDDGEGFDYGKYLALDEETLCRNIGTPCGRGIFMASRWFDSVVYSNGGSRVLLTKKL